MGSAFTAYVRGRRRPAFVGLVAAIAVAALGAGSGSSPGKAAAAAGPCGTLTGPPATFKHVVVIMDENQSYGAIIGAPGSAADTSAPAINSYARSCGVATNYHAITHPSHSDYIAATAGNTYVAPGCKDWTCVSQQLSFCDANGNTGGTMTCPNVFSQLDSRGISWKTYAENMPSNCATSAADPYSAGHNPPVWFIQGGGSYNLASSCAAHDVPLTSSTAGLQHDIDNNSLPAYSWIVPNKCNDMHNCSGQNPVTAGDTFIKTWVDRIIATPDYQNGSTVIVLTWDEGVEGGRPFNEDCLAQANLSDESCHVPTVVLSPYITPGTAPSTFFTHYSLLKTTEKMLGVTQYLGHAGDAGTTDMLAAFGLAGGGGGGDTQAPSAPTQLSAAATSSTAVHLTWTAASDNVGVTGYRIYRDGTLIKSVGNVTQADDTGLAPSTTYGYQVSAVDAAGNESARSTPIVSATTNASGGTTLLSDNFESGTLGKWTVKGSVVDQNAVVLNGSWAAHATTTGTPSNAAAPLATTATSVTVDVHARVASHGATNTDLVRVQTAAAKNLVTVSINSSNRLLIRNNITGTSASSTTPVSLNAWHDIVITVTTGSSGTSTVKLDGVAVTALSRTWNLDTTPVGRLQLGDSTKSRSSSIYFDDVSVS
jgi:phospholipase C